MARISKRAKVFTEFNSLISSVLYCLILINFSWSINSSSDLVSQSFALSGVSSSVKSDLMVTNSSSSITTVVSSSSSIKAPWINGEILQYEIGWGFIPAGRAYIQTVPMGGNKLLFRTRATNGGNFTGIYPVRDTIDTWVNKNNLVPYKFTKILNEGGWHSRTHIDFNHAKGIAVLKDSVFDFDKKDNAKLKRSSDTIVNIAEGTHCIISAFFKIRTFDLQPGKECYFNAVDGKKTYKMKVICHKYETIKTDLGEFKCIKVEPVLVGDGIFKAKGKLYVWFTRDERRLPIKMKSKISVGSIYADLVKIK